MIFISCCDYYYLTQDVITSQHLFYWRKIRSYILWRQQGGHFGGIVGCLISGWPLIRGKGLGFPSNPIYWKIVVGIDILHQLHTPWEAKTTTKKHTQVKVTTLSTGIKLTRSIHHTSGTWCHLMNQQVLNHDWHQVFDYQEVHHCAIGLLSWHFHYYFHEFTLVIRHTYLCTQARTEQRHLWCHSRGENS